MASPLHDNPRSKGEDKKEPAKEPEKKADEPKNEKGQTQGEERDDVSDKSPTGEEAKASPRDLFMDGLKQIRARHEAERRDHHGNMRDAMRQIGKRHDKEMKDHFDLHFPEVPGEGGTAAGGVNTDAAPGGVAEE